MERRQHPNLGRRAAEGLCVGLVVAGLALLDAFADRPIGDQLLIGLGGAMAISTLIWIVELSARRARRFRSSKATD
jgi:hypothetical protein